MLSPRDEPRLGSADRGRRRGACCGRDAARSPARSEGSRFSDGDRASGSSAFWRRAFLCSPASSSSSPSRATTSLAWARSRALALGRQIETAQFFPTPVAAELSGELICYGRSVVHVEWPEAEGGNAVGDVNPGASSSSNRASIPAPDAGAGSAFDKWLDHTADREAARIDRVHGAEGVIPSPLWIVLILLSVVIVGYVFFFADSAEQAVSQGVLMGSVAATLAAMLLLISSSTARSRRASAGSSRSRWNARCTFDQALVAVGREADPPCDKQGRRSS